MKKYSILLLVAVFAAALFTGCGCRNSRPAETSMPTVPTTSAPTTHSTEPVTVEPMPGTDATIEDGNGPLPTNATAGADGNTDTATTDAADTARSRSRSATENTNATTGIDGRTHRVMPKN